jgi:3'(2'), 5'-bisphosphate nucleotidase
MQNLEKLLENVIFIVKEAGAKTLTFYGGEYSIKDKGNDSPVTQADIASNEILIKGLEKYGYPILSEEGAPEENIACPLGRLKADIVWIIDPLDGTKDFIDETGEFTIMVGLVEKQADGSYRPVLGVIYRPVSDTVYFAVKGQGAFALRKEEKIEKLVVSPELEWHNMIMLTSRNHTTDLEWQVAKKLHISKVITFGSSLKACLIAEKEGHVNFNPSKYTWEWDVCASDIIVHEAGGLFTDIKGNMFNYNKKDPRNNNGYLASNGVNHSDVLNEISKK